jgi:hypothetical protein
MCSSDEEVGVTGIPIGEEDPKVMELWRKVWREPSLEGFASYLVSVPQEFKDYASRNQNGFVRYGDVRPGSKVLIASSSLHDPEVVNALVKAFRAKGATVDVMFLDDGEDRELRYDDEIVRIIRTEPWWIKPRWYDYQERVLNIR